MKVAISLWKRTTSAHNHHGRREGEEEIKSATTSLSLAVRSSFLGLSACTFSDACDSIKISSLHAQWKPISASKTTETPISRWVFCQRTFHIRQSRPQSSGRRTSRYYTRTPTAIFLNVADSCTWNSRAMSTRCSNVHWYCIVVFTYGVRRRFVFIFIKYNG